MCFRYKQKRPTTKRAIVTSKINPRTPRITKDNKMTLKWVIYRSNARDLPKAIVVADTVSVVGVFDGVVVKGGIDVGVLDEVVVALIRLEGI